MVLKGHCLCKAVTYTIDMDAPLLVGYDHCDDCQRQSGSTYCKSADAEAFRGAPLLGPGLATLEMRLRSRRANWNTSPRGRRPQGQADGQRAD